MISLYPYIIVVLCPPKQLHLSDFDFIPISSHRNFPEDTRHQGHPRLNNDDDSDNYSGPRHHKDAGNSRPLPTSTGNISFQPPAASVLLEKRQRPLSHRTRAVLRCSNLFRLHRGREGQSRHATGRCHLQRPVLAARGARALLSDRSSVPRVVHYVQFSPSGK